MSSVPLSYSCSKYLVPTALQPHWNLQSLCPSQLCSVPHPHLCPAESSCGIIVTFLHALSATCSQGILPSFTIVLLLNLWHSLPHSHSHLMPLLSTWWCILNNWKASCVLPHLWLLCHYGWKGVFQDKDNQFTCTLDPIPSYFQDFHSVILPSLASLVSPSQWLLLRACKHGVIYVIIKKIFLSVSPFPHHANLLLFTTKRLETIIYMHSLPFPVETVSVATFINFQPSSHLTY